MKRNTVKKLLAAMMVSAMALGLTACGGGDSAADSAADTASESGADDTQEDSSAEEGTSEDSSADSAGGGAAGAEGLSIGATYYTLQTEFCMRMDDAAKVWAEENGVKYTSYDGNNDAAAQLEQVETMIADGVDAIILNPQDADACSACVDAAVEAGIPDRRCKHYGKQ